MGMCRSLHRIIALLLVSLAVPAVNADMLWNQAVAAYERSLQWVPGRIELLTEQYSGSGELRSRAIVVSERSTDADGEVSYEVVESEQLVGRGDPESGFPGFPGDDGEEEGDPERFAAVGASPFDPDLQERVHFERIGSGRTPAGRPAVTYRFRMELEQEARASGTVWLDPDSGLPLRVVRTVDPPMAVIRSFEVEEAYEPAGDHWRVDRFMVDVVGRVLFVERRVRMDMAFRNHVFDAEGFGRQR